MTRPISRERQTRTAARTRRAVESRRRRDDELVFLAAHDARRRARRRRRTDTRSPSIVDADAARRGDVSKIGDETIRDVDRRRRAVLGEPARLAQARHRVREALADSAGDSPCSRCTQRASPARRAPGDIDVVAGASAAATSGANAEPSTVVVIDSSTRVADVAAANVRAGAVDRVADTVGDRRADDRAIVGNGERDEHAERSRGHRGEIAQRRGDGAISDLARREPVRLKCRSSTAVSTLTTSAIAARNVNDRRVVADAARARSPHARASRESRRTRRRGRVPCCRSSTQRRRRQLGEHGIARRVAIEDPSCRAARRRRPRVRCRATRPPIVTARARRRDREPTRAIAPATNGSPICASSVPAIPLSTSPLPPVASAGVPAALTSRRPSAR